ncbi:MAG: dihydropyrimidinase [bacterium]
MDILIKNGTIVTSEEVFKGNLLIKDKIIEKISKEELEVSKDVHVIDAKNKLILPGGIDAHTHLDMPFMGAFSTDDFYSGTVAAAFGGTTSIIDYIIPKIDQSLNEAYSIWKQKAESKSVIDYGFHMAIVPSVESAINQLAELKTLGISSIKCFLAYKNSLMLNDEELEKLFEAATQNNLLVCIHAENGEEIHNLVNKYINENKTAPIYHALSRPPELECEAVQKVLNTASLKGSDVYFVHLSTKSAIEEIQKYKNSEINAYAETCPQYLMYSQEKYEEENFGGAKYVMSPPLRESFNKDYLLQASLGNQIDVIATDHCPFNFKKEKQKGINDFSKIPNGVPGIETRLPLMFSKLVKENRMPLTQFVRLNFTNPAKIFKIKNKGDIKIGYDADICIWDADFKWTITKEKLHENVDYTIYEGEEITGKPIIVISKGEIIIENNSFKGNAGNGQYLFRS